MYTLKVFDEKKDRIIKFKGSANLAELLITNNIFIDRPCGGKGKCGKCAVRFLSNAPRANKYDKNELSKKQLDKGYRLACKCIIKGDAQIQSTSKNNMVIKSDGLPQKNKIHLNDASLSKSYGIAIDLGTTTIVAYLVKLSNGRTVGVESATNPQRKYGDNVITRCEYIHNYEDGLKTLQSVAIDEINHLIKKLCAKNDIKSKKIKRLVLSGNTIMQHIVIGVDPYPIALAPFTPVFTEQKKITAKEFGIGISPSAKCYIVNSVSGYIGGDIVSGIVATKMHKSKSTCLLVDIGTNGEIVLKSNGEMFACSVAAGPAFEGEHIKHGVGGISGAISKAYKSKNKLEYETIDNSKPVGICGSGLLDITAYLLYEGIVDEMGTMDESKCKKADDEIVYYITDDIYISQKDIREIQLAKSAVAAGIAVLIQKANIKNDDIDKVYLAGGFGSYLNVDSAAKIGLIPKKLKKKCISAGNTAGTGSVSLLLNDKLLSSLDKLTKEVEYIELSLDPTFNELFVDNMLF